MMSTIEPDGLEQGTREGEQPSVRYADHNTIYDEIFGVISERGWARGRRTDRSGAADLAEAVDVATVRTGTTDADAIVRSARIRNHLVALAGTAHLSTWNDERNRTLADIEELLRHASIAFPDD